MIAPHLEQPTPYQLTINNCAAFLKNEATKTPNNKSGINAFQISEVLAIAFCTTKEKVMDDLLINYHHGPWKK